MKSIIIIFVLCSTLPLGINGAGGESSRQTENPYQRALRKHGDSVKQVLDRAAKVKPINDELIPLTFLDSGDVGFYFRGLRKMDNKPVAIKFIKKKHAKYARKEYEMYSHMKAINKTGVEKYGIAAVYYYGKWKNFIVTAYTDLEETLAHRIKLDHVETYDILFVIQQFIKQSKYMHSRGVRHDDVKLENILLRNCECFLNDFVLASRMIQDNKGQSILMASLRFHSNQNRVAMDDWESFLYTICELSGVIHLDWFDESLENRMKIDEEGTKQLIGDMKANRTKILDIITKSLHDNSPLQTVLVALANEVFSGKLIPNYDEFDAVVTDVLERVFSDKKCFSWVMKHFEGEIIDLLHQEKVQKSIENKNQIKIADIKVPKNFLDYRSFEYPPVNETIFQIEQEQCVLI